MLDEILADRSGRAGWSVLRAGDALGDPESITAAAAMTPAASTGPAIMASFLSQGQRASRPGLESPSPMTSGEGLL